MTLGAILLDKKTQVLTSLGTLVFVIAFSVTATYSFSTWKTKFETIQESEKVRLSLEIEERKEADKLLSSKLDETMTVMIETQKDLSEIKTDLKWIRAALEDD